MALLAPLPLGTLEAAPPARAEAAPGPVLWQVGDVTVRWGPNAVEAGLVEFLETRTPPRARTLHGELQDVLRSPPAEGDWASAATESGDLVDVEMEDLVSRVSTPSQRTLLRHAYIQSADGIWNVNSARSYPRDTLYILSPIVSGIDSLYETLGLTMTAEQRVDLLLSLQHLTLDEQEMLSVLVHAVGDAHRESARAWDASATPPLDVLVQDTHLVIDALGTLTFSDHPDAVVADIPLEDVPAIEAATTNLTAYRSIRTVQAAIFLLEAVEEVLADVRTLPPPLTRPTTSPCPGYVQGATPLFADPLCIIVYEPHLPISMACAPDQVPAQVLVVTGPGPDTFHCPVGASVGGASLLLDLGGDNQYRWNATEDAPLRNRWAFGAAVGGAAVVYDLSACSSVVAHGLAGGVGAGLLGTGVFVAGAGGGACAAAGAMDVEGDGHVQGAGTALGIGLFDYLGAAPLRVVRYGLGSGCVFDGLIDGTGAPLSCGPPDIADRAALQRLRWGMQGTGTGVLGSAGILRSASPDTALLNRFGPAASCPAGSDSATAGAHSATTGLGVGFAGLGAVVQHGGGTLVTGTAACTEDDGLPTLAQGVGGLYGLGIVSARDALAVDRAIGGAAAGYPSAALGLGFGWLGGVGAVVDASEAGAYRICSAADDAGSACSTSSSGRLHGGGVGAALGVGHFRHAALGAGATSYTCGADQTRCFGGLAELDHDDVLCRHDAGVCAAFAGGWTVPALGLFRDAGGADTYVGGAAGIGNDRYGHVSTGTAYPFTGLFLDCEDGTDCVRKAGGFAQ